MKHKTCCSFIRRHFLLHHLLQSTRLFIITSIIIKSKTTISRTPYSSKFHSLGVIPPHLAPPFLHRLSNVFNVQSTVGFPSFALTSLCLSQTQTLSASLEETSGGCSSISRLKSSLHTVHGYKSPSASKNLLACTFSTVEGFSGKLAAMLCKSPHVPVPRSSLLRGHVAIAASRMRCSSFSSTGFRIRALFVVDVEATFLSGNDDARSRTTARIIRIISSFEEHAGVSHPSLFFASIACIIIARRNVKSRESACPRIPPRVEENKMGFFCRVIEKSIIAKNVSKGSRIPTTQFHPVTKTKSEFSQNSILSSMHFTPLEMKLSSLRHPFSPSSSSSSSSSDVTRHRRCLAAVTTKKIEDKKSTRSRRSATTTTTTIEGEIKDVRKSKRKGKPEAIGMNFVFESTNMPPIGKRLRRSRQHEFVPFGLMLGRKPKRRCATTKVRVFNSDSSGGTDADEQLPSLSATTTRLGRALGSIYKAASKRVKRNFNRIPIALIALLVGISLTAFFPHPESPGDAFITFTIVTLGEFLSSILYSEKNQGGFLSWAKYGESVPIFLNAFKIGVFYGLFIDAFKVGS